MAITMNDVMNSVDQTLTQLTAPEYFSRFHHAQQEKERKASPDAWHIEEAPKQYRGGYMLVCHDSEAESDAAVGNSLFEEYLGEGTSSYRCTASARTNSIGAILDQGHGSDG